MPFWRITYPGWIVPGCVPENGRSRKADDGIRVDPPAGPDTKATSDIGTGVHRVAEEIALAAHVLIIAGVELMFVEADADELDGDGVADLVVARLLVLVLRLVAVELTTTDEVEVEGEAVDVFVLEGVPKG